MKNRNLIILIYLTLLLILPSCGGGSSGTGGENGVKVNKVTGTVTDDNNQPVEGATVNIEGQNETVVTDKNGNFLIEIDNPDNLELNNTKEEVTLEFNINNDNYSTITLLNVPSYNTVSDVKLVVSKKDKKTEPKDAKDETIPDQVIVEEVTPAPIVEEVPTEPCDYYSGTVCAENGITYANECIAFYDNTIATHSGSCPYAPNAGNCSEYRPVCGSDGITYDNSCLANQAGVIIVFFNRCYRL